MTNLEISVAYADDHTVVRKGITSIINSFEGIYVNIEAGNGHELISQIEKKKQIPDVCVVDLNMPVMNGFDTTIELKKRWPDIKVLILSASYLELYIIKAISNRANGYLIKNCDPDEIRRAITALYNSSTYYTDIVTKKYFYSVINKMVALPDLTAKELQVLVNCCSDLSYSEIAEKLKTTTRSVEGFRDSLFKKLNTNSRVGLAAFAIRYGLVPIDPPIPEINPFIHENAST